MTDQACHPRPRTFRDTITPGRSLIGRYPGPILCSMFSYFPARQLAAVIVALGVFLSGAAPSWAATTAHDAKSMPGMSTMAGMDDNCMQMAGKATKQAPCKDTDTSCAACTGCAVNIALALDLVSAPIVYFRASGLSGADASPDGIAT